MARGQGGIRSPIDFLTEIFVGPASRRSPSFGNSRIAAAFSSLRSAHWCRALVSCHSFTSVVRTCFRTYRKRAMGREGFSIRVAPHIPIRHMCRRATCVSLLPVRIQTGRYTYQRFTDAATMVTFVNGGQGGIRTPEGECQQIYSLPRLTASVPTHGAVARSRQAEPGPAVPETATTHNAALLPPLQPLRGVARQSLVRLCRKPQLLTTLLYFPRYSRCAESNRGPTPYHGVALPTELQRL